ncbi:CPBP family intramembrane glutamic endopeptidase [Fodinicola acaciae]|uniref:CPBP family intramembrane glutamic endopeptidase n=1 Tax=Fodinicola acaciae TaxID=2681555 RepID=UPI0013CFCE57|nr:CPBP family intramembrane glutamic endopeptidase [Fodinicola acaciae]
MTTLTQAPPSGRVRGFVRRHPLLTFFALADGISWLLWLPFILSYDGLGTLSFKFPELLGSSQLLGIMPGAYFGPLTAAFVVTAAAEGAEGLREWRGRLFRVRVRLRWYAAALFVAPLVIAVGSLAVPGVLQTLSMPALSVLPAYLGFLLLQILTSGLAEEPGWRDFALPRLQKRFGAVLGTTILGLLWGLWHYPLFLTSWGEGGGWRAIVQFTIATVAFSFVLTWLFNRSGQSVPMVILMHASFNNFLFVVWPQLFPGVQARGNWGPAIGLTGAALLLIWLTGGRLGLKD